MSVPGATCGRVQVLTEIVVILKMPIAGGYSNNAVQIGDNIPSVRENPSADAAEMVASLVVVFKFVCVVEVFVAGGTVMVLFRLAIMG